MAKKLQFYINSGATASLPQTRGAYDFYVLTSGDGNGKIAVGQSVWNESVQINSTDSVLAYDNTSGLSATLSLSYNETDKKIILKGKGDAVISEIDATSFIKDGMLDKAEYVSTSNELVFTFNTESGKEEIRVNVAGLVDTYNAGNGLSLTDHTFSVKVDSASESFLTVGAEGVKLSGVQSAIDAAKDAVTALITAEQNRAEKAEQELGGEIETKASQDDLDALEGVVTSHTADKVAHITADERTAWNAAEQNAKDYADDVAATAEKNAKDYADSLAGNYDAAGSASQALTDAKDYADSLARNYDAAGSAAQALTDAKAYADGLDKAMDTRVDELEAKKHEHANKTTLDAITAEKVADWDDAVSKEHVHSNKEVLDTITAEKVANWDGSLASAKSYADEKAASAKDAAIADAATKYQLKGNYETAGSAAQALTDAKAYADDVAADAQSAAITAAATDATNKANAAEQNANGYADGLKTTIDAYTVNGKKISENPVLNGGDVKLDGYTIAASSDSVAATDTVNAAIGKLEKSIADVSAAAVKLGTQSGNVRLDNTNGLTASLEWMEF